MGDLHYNRSIKLLLRELASLNPELGPHELSALWFDDLYFPCQLPPPDYPVDTWKRGQNEWTTCFTDRELTALASVHEVFVAEVDALPTTGEWRQNAGWRRVSEAARVALHDLEPSST
jgi:hypothetical protein